MGLTVHACSLLSLLMGQALTQCIPQNYTLYLERKECNHCMTINTTICSGFCYSRDTNVRGLMRKRFAFQQTCMYQTLVYHTAELPGCPHNVDPLFFYPVALGCHCSRCNTTSNECIHKSKRSTKCSKSHRYMNPFPG